MTNKENGVLFSPEFIEKWEAKLKKDEVIVVNNCGKGYKDKKIYIENIGYYPK